MAKLEYEKVYDTFVHLREEVGDEAILDELQQYLSTDELQRFVEHFKSMYDDYMGIEDESDKEDHEDWIDPAGGRHSWGEDDPAKMYESIDDYKGLNIDIYDVQEWLKDAKQNDSYNEDEIQLVIDCLEDNGITKRQLKVRAPKSFGKKYAIWGEDKTTGDVFKKQIEIKRLIGKENIEKYLPWETFKNILYGIIMETSKL
jgi:hypothetical protein